MTTRTWLDSTRDIVVDLAGLDWLTVCAFLFTVGCLGCAVLDSYTSLCVVGATSGHIGDQGACFTFGGWDTRVFPLAVDMGWGGALCAVLRLAREIGLKSWRWWVVLSFEALTAAFTIAGNAFHGAVASGAIGSLGPWAVIITCVASAVPGVTAVGSGFTLSVLWSVTRPVTPEPTKAAQKQAAYRARQKEGNAPAEAGNKPVTALTRASNGRVPSEVTS